MYKKREESEKGELISQNHTLFCIWYYHRKQCSFQIIRLLGIGGNVTAFQKLDLSPMEYLENKVMRKTNQKERKYLDTQPAVEALDTSNQLWQLQIYPSKGTLSL